MGYDFMLEKARNAASQRFPCMFHELDTADTGFPWTHLKQRLYELGGSNSPAKSALMNLIASTTDPASILPEDLLKQMTEATPSGEAQNEVVELEVEGKGWMSVSGSPAYASVDMHADWQLLEDLFRWIRKMDPDIVLSDMNSGMYHDPDSFHDLAQFDVDSR